MSAKDYNIKACRTLCTTVTSIERPRNTTAYIDHGFTVNTVGSEERPVCFMPKNSGKQTAWNQTRHLETIHRTTRSHWTTGDKLDTCAKYRAISFRFVSNFKHKRSRSLTKYAKKKIQVHLITGRKVLTMMDSAVKVQWIPLDRIFPKYEYSMLQVWNYCKILLFLIRGHT